MLKLIRRTGAVALTATLAAMLFGCGTVKPATKPENKEFVFDPLTRLQMQNDFDYLIKMVKESYPKLYMSKELYNIDIIKILESYRDKVTGKESPAEFMALLGKATSSCKGDHFNCMDFYYSKDYKVGNAYYPRYYSGLFSNEDIAITHAYCQAYSKLEKSKSKFNLPLYYRNLNYYVMYDFYFNKQKFPAGARLVSYNNKSVPELLKANQDKMDSFDFTNKVFYSDKDFVQQVTDYKLPKLNFVFEDKNKKQYTLNIKKTDSCTFAPDHRNRIAVLDHLDARRVSYFERDKVLYIRLPRMNSYAAAFYKQRILEESKNRELHAIVIDIRNNGGGSDMTWYKLISYLVAEKFSFKSKLGLKNTAAVHKYLHNRRATNNCYSQLQIKPEKIAFLNNEDFYISEGHATLNPDADSIRFNGPVYILCERIYSSAGSFMMSAEFSDQFTSIGPTNYIDLGRGMDPIAFALPNSRIIIRFGCDIDLTNCKNIKDTAHIENEVPLEVINTRAFHYNSLSEAPKGLTVEQQADWLLQNKDKFYKKAMELMRKK